MGMAASQARYLALTARKSNIEFQGQQINQQRTLLSVEQSEVFAELTNLENPIAPTKTDYVFDVYTLNAKDTSGAEHVYRIRKDSIIEEDDVSTMTVYWSPTTSTESTGEMKGTFNKTNTMLIVTNAGTVDIDPSSSSSTEGFQLSSGTWTDEDGYNEAMAQYNQKIAVYNSEVEKINQKSEQIQLKDRTLELKLRNLDTEQNAVQTELESVKKVIEDTVKNVFKTFQSS